MFDAPPLTYITSKYVGIYGELIKSRKYIMSTPVKDFKGMGT